MPEKSHMLAVTDFFKSCFVSFLVRENLRELRENLKYKFRPLDSLPEQYRDFYGRQLIARLEQKCLSKKDITE